MDPRRLRRGVTAGAIAATAAVAVVIAGDPLPGTAPVAEAQPAPAPEDVGQLASLENSVIQRIDDAERWLRAFAGEESSAQQQASPPVSVAPSWRAPVTRSASS